MKRQHTWRPGQPIPEWFSGHPITFAFNEVALEHVLDALRKEYPSGYTALGKIVAAAINGATPPKPDEPKGLGAVVEDAEGEKYVRHCFGDCPDKGLCIPWSRVEWGTKHKWDDVNAVRVLSEGVS